MNTEKVKQELEELGLILAKVRHEVLLEHKKNIRTLTITVEDGVYVIDEPALPGAPYVGRGEDLFKAIGEWFYLNKSSFNVEFVNKGVEICVKN